MIFNLIGTATRQQQTSVRGSVLLSGPAQSSECRPELPEVRERSSRINLQSIKTTNKKTQVTAGTGLLPCAFYWFTTGLIPENERKKENKSADRTDQTDRTDDGDGRARCAALGASGVGACIAARQVGGSSVFRAENRKQPITTWTHKVITGTSWTVAHKSSAKVGKVVFRADLF